MTVEKLAVFRTKYFGKWTGALCLEGIACKTWGSSRILCHSVMQVLQTSPGWRTHVTLGWGLCSTETMEQLYACSGIQQVWGGVFPPSRLSTHTMRVACKKKIIVLARWRLAASHLYPITEPPTLVMFTAHAANSMLQTSDDCVDIHLEAVSRDGEGARGGVISGSLEEDDGPATFGGEGARQSKSEEDRGVLKQSTNEGAGLDSLDAKGSLSALGRVGMGVDNRSSKALWEAVEGEGDWDSCLAPSQRPGLQWEAAKRSQPQRGGAALRLHDGRINGFSACFIHRPHWMRNGGRRASICILIQFREALPLWSSLRSTHSGGRCTTYTGVGDGAILFRLWLFVLSPCSPVPGVLPGADLDFADFWLCPVQWEHWGIIMIMSDCTLSTRLIREVPGLVPQ
ncbi:hypothetical protein DFH08DRAFT_817394 [Mycena albidolilacea]|uniref:Uncharacterized protein n=1 Tax=Mycena albidolilacea TaxID=1033008 RepID=A0AAD6ZIW9_9AGAR|nr:hypothetical protein DFH08DRAFT_817394 [Mycena albidolilacea]